MGDWEVVLDDILFFCVIKFVNKLNKVNCFGVWL